jgi:hypothetical protein
VTINFLDPWKQHSEEYTFILIKRCIMRRRAGCITDQKWHRWVTEMCIDKKRDYFWEIMWIMCTVKPYSHFIAKQLCSLELL